VALACFNPLSQTGGWQKILKFAKINNRIYRLQAIFIDTVFMQTGIGIRSSAHWVKQCSYGETPMLHGVSSPLPDA
jgi:hypothetical protein